MLLNRGNSQLLVHSFEAVARLYNLWEKLPNSLHEVISYTLVYWNLHSDHLTRLTQFLIVFLALLQVVPRVHVNHAAFQGLYQIVHARPHLRDQTSGLAAKRLYVSANLKFRKVMTAFYYVKINVAFRAQLTKHLLYDLAIVQDVVIAVWR